MKPIQQLNELVLILVPAFTENVVPGMEKKGKETVGYLFGFPKMIFNFYAAAFAAMQHAIFGPYIFLVPFSGNAVTK